MKNSLQPLSALLGCALLAGIATGCAPVAEVATGTPPPIDMAAAKALAQKDSCLRCHGLNKEKRGPAYSAIAAGYRDKPDAEHRLYEHLTSGEAAVQADGHVEAHKIIHTQHPDEIRNLVRWILVQ